MANMTSRPPKLFNQVPAKIRLNPYSMRMTLHPKPSLIFNGLRVTLTDKIDAVT